MSAFRNHLRQLGAVWTGSIRRTFAPHLPLYVCAVLFVGATLAVANAYQAPIRLDSSLFFLRKVPMYLALVLMIAATIQFFKLAARGSRSPLKDFGAWLHDTIHWDDRPGKIVHSVVTITPLMIAFGSIKAIIPLLTPFTWDQTFDQWDRILTFGYRPWELLQPFLGYAPVTWLISFVYTLWFFVMFGTLFWQAFFAGGLRRMQFLLAFSLSWFVAGNVLALMFSSAGPCYYGFLFPVDPYADQMAYLKQARELWPVTSVDVQDRLWQSYLESGGGVNIGISAMPSMHVIIAVLTAIVAWPCRRWLRISYAAFATIVVIGSVHLAWHYAVDSIAGVGLAFAFWYVAGAIVRARARTHYGALPEPASSAPAS
jgi:hypothetical protein